MRNSYERETIVNYNQAEAEASVYTFDPKLIRKLQLFAEKHPDEVRLEEDFGDGAFSYAVPKKCVQIREPYSKEQRAAARERALKNKSRPPKRDSDPKIT